MLNVSLSLVYTIDLCAYCDTVVGCCLGRLLPRFLLASQFRLPWTSLRFGTTAAGRPYAVCITLKNPIQWRLTTIWTDDEQIHPNLLPGLDYNISHDSNWTVLAWNIANNTNKQADRVGVDVMRVKIPWEGETVQQFIDGLRDQVCFSILDVLPCSLLIHQ